MPVKVTPVKGRIFALLFGFHSGFLPYMGA